jgi:hypothetical protein
MSLNEAEIRYELIDPVLRAKANTIPKTQLAEMEKARQAAESQPRKIQLLSRKILAQAFGGV